MAAYYSVEKPSAGDVQADVWQDHNQDAYDEEYTNPGVQNLRQRFSAPQDSRPRRRSLGSARAPPPRPMTPPRDFDGTEVFDGSGREPAPPKPQPQPRQINVMSSKKVHNNSRTAPNQGARLSQGPAAAPSGQRLQGQPQWEPAQPPTPAPPQYSPQTAGQQQYSPQTAGQQQYSPQAAGQQQYSPRTAGQQQYSPQTAGQRSPNYQTSMTIQPSRQGPNSQSFPSKTQSHQPPAPPRSPVYQPQATTLQPVDSVDTGECRVVHLQYNSPLQLYSTDNAKQTLDAQTRGAPGYGTLMVKGNTQEFDPSSSHVLRAIQDEERGGPSAGFQPARSSRSFRMLQPSSGGGHGSDF